MPTPSSKAEVMLQALPLVPVYQKDNEKSKKNRAVDDEQVRFSLSLNAVVSSQCPRLEQSGIFGLTALHRSVGLPKQRNHGDGCFDASAHVELLKEGDGRVKTREEMIGRNERRIV